MKDVLDACGKTLLDEHGKLVEGWEAQWLRCWLMVVGSVVDLRE